VTSVATARYVILLGGPGAGKGTQALTLTRTLGLPHMASGDVFRSVRQEDSELDALVRSYYDKGLLIPDDVTIRIILSVLARDEYGAGAMLDGFPRTLDQARALDESLAASGKSIAKVLYIRVPAEELVKRISGRLLCRGCSAVYHERNTPPRKAGVCDACGGELYQRVDDSAETARTRLDAYFRDTEPLVDYYRRQGRLCEVDGLQSVEAVGQDLQRCMTEEGR
jgi:adenylate kinase